VYNDMGCGFNEPIYQECLEIEMAVLESPFVVQPQQRRILSPRLTASPLLWLSVLSS